MLVRTKYFWIFLAAAHADRVQTSLCILRLAPTPHVEYMLVWAAEWRHCWLQPPLPIRDDRHGNDPFLVCSSSAFPRSRSTVLFVTTVGGAGDSLRRTRQAPLVPLTQLRNWLYARNNGPTCLPTPISVHVHVVSVQLSAALRGIQQGEASCFACCRSRASLVRAVFANFHNDWLLQPPVPRSMKWPPDAFHPQCD